MRRDAALELLPLVQDDEWFFDTELLVTAQRLGLRIHEVPVHWVDDTDSGAWSTRDRDGVWPGISARRRRLAPAMLGTVQALGSRAAWPEQEGREVFADELLRFAGVGAVSTLCYIALFAAFRRALGSYTANALAIGLCSLANTAVHRGLVGAAAIVSANGVGGWARCPCWR